MMTPFRPTDEIRRLATVKALGALAKPQGPQLERVTRLAQRLFDVPMAIVSLIHDERRWFTSAIGLTEPGLTRAIQLCNHAIPYRDIVQVPDTRADARLCDEPLIRFYAGYPLTAPGGARIGALCLLDTHPRLLDED